MTNDTDFQGAQAAQAAVSSKPAAGQGQERNKDAPAEPNELEKKIEQQLVDLVRQYERESDVVRRHHVRRFLEAEEFWKGNQHLIWSERAFKWHTPFEWALENGKQPSELPKYGYVTNLYQSFGLSVIAALSQRLPKVRFTPKSAKSERDVATAKAADDVCEVIERNNSLDQLSVRYAYLMWTQGIFGAYVRYVLDTEFGTQDIPQVEMGMVEIAPDRYACQACGAEIPLDELHGQAGLMPQQAGMQCPNCGYQLTDMDFQPQEMGEGPIVTGTIEYPNGQEVITVYGGLNMKLMPQAQTQKDTPYLILAEEVHSAALKAAYPGKAKKIGTGSSGDADNTFEKHARLALTDSPGQQKNQLPIAGMVTYTRAWLRDWALWAIDDDDVRTELLKRYPKGVLVALADNDFLEAREEALDDHWEICTPMPGQGIYREGVGASTIPIQKRYNDAANVQAEHIEFGSAPPVFFDARYINREALEKRRMQPASFFPIVTQGAPAGTDITKLMHQPELKIDSNIYQYGKDLIEVAQTVNGAMPTIFGGSMDGNDTARGYAMSRAQSLGKLGLFWRAVKQFHCRLMLKAVEVFRDNRSDDYEHVVFGKSGDYISKWIHLEDLRGNITAQPEADEDFPASWAEVRENLISLIQQVPEYATGILQHPANAPLIRKFIANNDLVLPMEDDREKQYREIYELLQGQPQPDPMTGELQCSILPEPFVDNHDAHIAAMQEWAVSDEGIEAKKTNPAGYANCMLHIVSHYQAKAEAEAAVQQIMAAPMMPPPDAAGQPTGAPADGAAGQPTGAPAPTVGDKLGEALHEALPGMDGVMNAKISA